MYSSPKDRLKELLHPFNKKYHKEFWALKNVNFEVKKGETIGIIGQNGSGKSTLLQLICRVLQPTFGHVEVNGKISALLELGSGFNPEFTGRENVYVQGAIQGFTREEIDKKFSEIVEFADIGEFLDQPLKTYSSGMMVRLAFSVATSVNPDILIIDEALAVGDAFFVQKCMRFLHEFKKKGTIFFVSHDVNAVVNLTNKAILLDKGQITMFESPKTVSEKYLEKIYAIQNDDIDNSNLAKVEKIIETDLSHNESEHNQSGANPVDELMSPANSELFNNEQLSSSFGRGGAKITDVFLSDSSGKNLSLLSGGEKVQLRIVCKAIQKIVSPIIGFQVKDRLGQLLFGDVTSYAYMNRPLDIKEADVFTAEFVFDMPMLQQGDYSIAVAIAEGTQENHIQHHWIHEALIFFN